MYSKIRRMLLHVAIRGKKDDENNKTSIETRM